MHVSRSSPWFPFIVLLNILLLALPVILALMLDDAPTNTVSGILSVLAAFPLCLASAKYGFTSMLFELPTLIFTVFVAVVRIPISPFGNHPVFLFIDAVWSIQVTMLVWNESLRRVGLEKGRWKFIICFDGLSIFPGVIEGPLASKEWRMPEQKELMTVL
ncbi:hypothetical protein FB451DRAFT_1173908 [Mycena latifolia]|nr:hypothetical protein FB451DRAFT_1173908 [Mycena latifolia]